MPKKEFETIGHITLVKTVSKKIYNHARPIVISFTSAAPDCFKSLAQVLPVVPVVLTSSTNSTLAPDIFFLLLTIIDPARFFCLEIDNYYLPPSFQRNI
jgi:hypothetical protein